MTGITNQLDRYCVISPDRLEDWMTGVVISPDRLEDWMTGITNQCVCVCVCVID